MVNKKSVVLAILLLLVGGALGYLVDSTGFFRNEEEVGQRVIETYSLEHPEAELELLDVRYENGLYRVLISAGQNTHFEVYATDDGEYITDSVIDRREYHTMLESRTEFMECLRDEEVQVFGALDANNTEVAYLTQVQLQQLGNLVGVEDLYQDCSQRMEECAEIGVTTLPSLVHGQEVYSGIHSLEQVNEITGCSY